MNEQEISAQPSEVKQLFDALTAQSGRKPEPPNNAPDKFGAAKNLPASYIEFMSLTDGWDEVGAGYIYGTAVGKNKDNMFVYTNEECKKDIEKYFYDLYDGEFKADDFTFFADDGMGGYYAFSKSERDEKVFYFDHDSPGTVTIYPDFVRWLKYKCKSDCLFMPDCITVQTAAKKAIWAAYRRKVSVYRKTKAVFCGIAAVGFLAVLSCAYMNNMDTPTAKRVLTVAGIILFCVGVFGAAMVTAPKIKTVVDKYYQNKTKSMPPESTDTETKRIPIDFSDERYAEKIEELKRYTEEFLQNVKYPAGFEEFLNEVRKENDPELSIKYIVKDRGSNGKYFKVWEFFAPGQIKEITVDLIVNTNDYYTQFRDILFFAGDESGHGNFFLDYGKNRDEPSVEFLDDEIDEVERVAETFAEFKSKVLTEKEMSARGIET